MRLLLWQLALTELFMSDLVFLRYSSKSTGQRLCKSLWQNVRSPFLPPPPAPPPFSSQIKFIRTWWQPIFNLELRIRLIELLRSLCWDGVKNEELEEEEKRKRRRRRRNKSTRENEPWQTGIRGGRGKDPNGLYRQAFPSLDGLIMSDNYSNLSTGMHSTALY